MMRATRWREVPDDRLVWLFRRIPFAQEADDYAALLPWNMPTALR
jgi:hypothetical protein